MTILIDTASVIALRRGVLRSKINQMGGRYILPQDNHQPDPILRIASIHLDGLTGIGPTEAAAQSDWFRQAANRAVQP